jgi:hypothetical protein
MDGLVSMSKTKQRKQRTIEELRAASQHYHYELELFKDLTRLMKTGPFESPPSFKPSLINDALLESYAIHLRNLIDFFYTHIEGDDKTKGLAIPKPEDMIAEDFFDSPDEWRNLRPKITDELKAARIRAHREIVHLTYHRIGISDKQKQWWFVELHDQIVLIDKIFLAWHQAAFEGL